MENQNKLVISIAPNVYEGIKSSRYSDDRIDAYYFETKIGRE